MIAAAKPTCPHCGSIVREQETGSNAAFDWKFFRFECGSHRQAYAKSGETVCETRSTECKAATGTIEPPRIQSRYGRKLSRSAGILAMNKLLNR